MANKAKPWPEQYRNSETGKIYKPHHEAEALWVADNENRYLLGKGGEGGGKSVMGVIRDLERIKYGASGIMASPDFEHFKRSLWPEFRRWCPWEWVVEGQRYRQNFWWEPGKPFQLAFINGAILYCGGLKESQIEAWEGPNVNFAHFDEARRHKKAGALKMLDGRVRIQVEHLIPQIWITTTPRMHWLYEYFGPWEEEGDDPRAAFKADSHVVTLLTEDNRENLAEGYVERRAQTLTEAEARVLLRAEWEDIEDTEPFLPSIDLWDLLKEELPALGEKEPMVLAMDAATGRLEGKADNFAILGVTRHPENREDVAVRFSQKWQPAYGKKLDFDMPEGPVEVLKMLCAKYAVVMVCYDPYQLHYLATRLNKENVAWFFEFNQGRRRLEADQQLLDLILQRRIRHNGNADLREHIKNSNRKQDVEERKLRIIKREANLKNDLAVCLSMAAYECLRLNL